MSIVVKLINNTGMGWQTENVKWEDYLKKKKYLEFLGGVIYDFRKLQLQTFYTKVYGFWLTVINYIVSSLYHFL